ncbi:MAG: phytoene desaturase family protein [Actinomycetes bacterium]
MARVVVVGAGMGGMAAAARLSAQGHHVHVVEQASTYGGKVGRYERDGFVFDTGPSLVTLPAVYRDLFLKTAVRRANASLEDNLDLIGLDPAFGYRWADGTSAVLPGANHTRVAQALDEALGGDAGAQWNAFSRRAAAMWAATRVPFLESPLTPADLVRYSRRLGDLRTIAPWSSLRGLGRQYLTDPRLATLLDRYATYAGSDPRRSPAALAVIPYVEQTFGAWHVGGGVRVLADALYRRCLDRGVTFAFDAAVTAIVTDADAVSGVRFRDGSTTAAQVVVADADASDVYGNLLDDARGRRPLRKLQRATPSLAGFVVLLALRGRTPGIQHHNVWFTDDYDTEFDSVFGGRVVDDPTVYACVPDDQAMRPDDEHESWFVLVNAPRHDPGRGVDWTAPHVVDRYADHILNILASRGADVRDRVLWREIRTPADLEHDVRAPGGSIYGTSSNGVRAAFLRPANRSPVPGLFLVGGSAHPGGGLPLVGLGAAIVAQQIGSA